MADHEFPAVHGRRYYTKSGYFKSLADQDIRRMVEALATIPLPASQIELSYLWRRGWANWRGRDGAPETPQFALYRKPTGKLV